MMSKAGSDKKTYHVGDEVPAVGDSFKYPEYFDILSVEDGAAVLIRDGKVEDIQKIEDYRYVGLPVVDERGMALLIKSRADLEKFLHRMGKGALLRNDPNFTINGPDLKPTEKLSARIISG